MLIHFNTLQFHRIAMDLAQIYHIFLLKANIFKVKIVDGIISPISILSTIAQRQGRYRASNFDRWQVPSV